MFVSHRHPILILSSTHRFPTQYAQNHLTVFLARVATTLDWTRIRSPVSDNILYLPTLYPADSVFNLTWRNKPQ